MEEIKKQTTAKAKTDWGQLEDELLKQNPQALPTKSSKKVTKNKHFSAQNTLQIAQIRDGIVILKDGSFRAVVEAEAINFDLMSNEEREAVEFAYQSFLNSLYFPIQINIQSRRVNANVYLKKIQANLKQQNNMLLSIMIEDYLIFVEDLIYNTDIMDKKFYIIVPFYNNEFSKDAATNAGRNLISKLWGFNKKAASISVDEKTLDKARKELRYRLQAITEGLRNCGVYSKPLGTQQLIQMYYEYYNPDSAVSESPPNFDEVAAPFVSKAGDYKHHEQADTRAESFSPAPEPEQNSPQTPQNSPLKQENAEVVETIEEVAAKDPALENPSNNPKTKPVVGNHQGSNIISDITPVQQASTAGNNDEKLKGEEL